MVFASGQPTALSEDHGILLSSASWAGNLRIEPQSSKEVSCAIAAALTLRGADQRLVWRSRFLIVYHVVLPLPRIETSADGRNWETIVQGQPIFRQPNGASGFYFTQSIDFQQNSHCFYF